MLSFNGNISYCQALSVLAGCVDCMIAVEMLQALMCCHQGGLVDDISFRLEMIPDIGQFCHFLWPVSFLSVWLPYEPSLYVLQ